SKSWGEQALWGRMSPHSYHPRAEDSLMKLKVQLVVCADDGREEQVQEVATPAFCSKGSTLIIKYVTWYCLIISPCSASDLHSMVQPRVYALGNHASTTAFFPLKSASV